MANKKNGNGAEEESGTPGIGHNSLSELGKAFVERVERLNNDVNLEKTACKEAVTGIRADINSVLAEAEKAGVPKKAVKMVVKQREAERKAAAARKAMTAFELDAVDNIRLALGDLAELPLGRAALGETGDTTGAAG